MSTHGSPTQSPPREKPTLIGLVEDDGPGRFLYAEMLRSAGYVVKEFAGVDEIKRHGWISFDLLVVDLLLRDRQGRIATSGIELVRTVSPHGIRCIAISASRFLLSQAFDAGAVLPLSKPIEKDVLLDGVKLALRMWWM